MFYTPFHYTIYTTVITDTAALYCRGVNPSMKTVISGTVVNRDTTQHHQHADASTCQDNHRTSTPHLTRCIVIEYQRDPMAHRSLVSEITWSGTKITPRVWEHISASLWSPPQPETQIFSSAFNCWHHFHTHILAPGRNLTWPCWCFGVWYVDNCVDVFPDVMLQERRILSHITIVSDVQISLFKNVCSFTSDRALSPRNHILRDFSKYWWKVNPFRWKVCISKGFEKASQNGRKLLLL
jgi:hypothetical protein